MTRRYIQVHVRVCILSRAGYKYQPQSMLCPRACGALFEAKMSLIIRDLVNPHQSEPVKQLDHDSGGNQS